MTTFPLVCCIKVFPAWNCEKVFFLFLFFGGVPKAFKKKKTGLPIQQFFHQITHLNIQLQTTYIHWLLNVGQVVSKMQEENMSAFKKLII